MPVANAPNNASVTTVAAVPIVFRTITFLVAGTQNTVAVNADGLPGARVWILQTAGPGLVTAQIQFADGVAGGLPDFQPLVPAFPILLNVPSLTGFTLGSRRYGVAITSTGAATVRYRLAGTLT